MLLNFEVTEVVNVNVNIDGLSASLTRHGVSQASVDCVDELSAVHQVATTL